jgi:hypothetical protein
MRSCLALFALLAAVVVAPSAMSASTKSVPIRIGVGIGPINLGMTGQQVRRALGRPRAVIERRVVRGRPYVEFEYHYGAWNVGLLGRRGQRRVVLVGTGLTRHKTPEGVGVGTKEREFFRRVRGQGYGQRSCPGPTGPRLLHWVTRRGATETIFFPHWREPPPDQATIVAVEVRSQPTLGCAF